MATETVEDERLSFRALGLLTFILSKPDNWEASSNRLGQLGREGRDAIRTALRELAVAGYVTRHVERDPDGRLRTVTLVWERPETDQPAPESQAPVDDANVQVAPETDQPAPVQPGPGQAVPTTKKKPRGTGESVASPKDYSSSSAPETPTRPEIDGLCLRLAERIIANGGRANVYLGKAKTRAWREPVRLLLDLDGISIERIAKAIDWCQADEFWSGIVLSTHKLREKYEALQVAAARKNGNGRRPQETSADHDARVDRTLRDLEQSAPGPGASDEEKAAYYARFDQEVSV